MNELIEYQATIDEMAAVTGRSLDWTGAMNRAKMQAVYLFPFLGFIAFVLLGGFSLKERIPVTILAAALASGFQLLTFKSRVRRNVRKALVAQYGGEGTIPVRYELTEDGLTYRVGAVETRIAWAGFAGVVLEGGFLIVDFDQPKGACMIPMRAFRDSGQATAWRDRIAAEIQAKAAA